MRCPRCTLDPRIASPYRDHAAAIRERPLLAREPHAAGFDVDRCARCRGVYLDHGELERIEIVGRGRSKRVEPLDLVRRAYEQAQRPSRGAAPEAPRCPACDGPMFEREWSIGTLVRVDVCLDCRGVWLDPGELETLEELFGAR